MNTLAIGQNLMLPDEKLETGNKDCAKNLSIFKNAIKQRGSDGKKNISSLLENVIIWKPKTQFQ